MQSDKWKLNNEDWKNWSFNFVRFVVVPTVIAFLTALQGGLDVKVAWGIALGTLYTSVIDLLRKAYSGTPEVKPADQVTG